MDIKEFIDTNFNIVLDDDGDKWVVWDETCKTMYDPFVNILFGITIKTGLEAGKTYEEIIKDMVVRSITQNYGLTEYIIRFTGVSFF
ncbi:hypothetical protein [uncultured Paenibacillus sp.]|uniref:hypothetical protein n=1 Tax=uncultured Paenibacillus sp. TaxID=227322 RepID=UPI0015ACE4D5|nr:hypothetical protein [uncultured Paenibacillus sp.]DAI82659.1 MAG TPA: hypothetical protein [Caudoviricetes sp.]